jgi:1-hydroxycarotenoid 3,4-desaturase
MAAAADRVVIVGAGIAGLVAALELAHAGREVIVCEARAAPGGKARQVPTAAGPVAGGPTVLTQRWVFDELFETVGERFGAALDIAPAEVLVRHVWPDGSRLDLFADAARSEQAVADLAGGEEAGAFRRFTHDARRLFEAFEGPVMRHPRPTPLSLARALGRALPRILLAAMPHATLWHALENRFADPRLRQLFGRYATYVGGSPFLSPAIFALVWWSEAAGVSLVRGGIAALAAELARLATVRGASFRFGEPVAEILAAGGRAAGVRLASGEVLPAAAVIFNGDPAALALGLLGPAVRHAAPPMPFPRRSLSACVWTFAGIPAGFPLAHHTVFFGPDPRAEFDDIFRRRRLPLAPSIYVCAEDREGTAAAPAPGGAERFLMIMNAPADGDMRTYGREEQELCRSRTSRRLDSAGLRLSIPDPATNPQALTMPDRFAAMFPGTGGALYGASPHGFFASFRRAKTRTPVPGLCLAGGGAHPGPGVPMAALSGRLAAAAILADRASMSRWRPTATPGGTSTVSIPGGAAASPSSASSARSSRPTMPGPAGATR